MARPLAARFPLLFALGALAFAFVGVAPSSAAGDRVTKRKPKVAVAWQELGPCRWVSGKFADGDDFVLRHGNQESIFRLYWVDAPECSLQVPDRVREQAASFGITEAQVLQLGQAAREFTARQLQGNVAVLTHWESALGTRRRYYAIVTVGRRDLGVELVRHGLARRHGRVPAGLDADRRRRLERDLENAEREARRHRRGAWGLSREDSGSDRRGTPPSPKTGAHPGR